jgi:hypothetical protein
VLNAASAFQTSVHTTDFLAQSYAKDTSYTFVAEQPYPIIHSTENGHYVLVREKHDFVLYLDNSAGTLTARKRDEALIFWETTTIQADRAYLTFPADEWYEVLEETDADYKIIYTVGQTKMHCRVNKADFQSAKHIKSTAGELLPRMVEQSKDAICVLNYSTGTSGSGFLLYVDNELYCYTNQHVVMSPGKLTINLIDNTQLQFGDIEIANDTDLARIKILSKHRGLEAIGSPQMQEKVDVLGNSLGAGRVTSLPGKVVGFSSTEIETTAKFVSGNSGSPIINEANEVIGVATLIETFPNHEEIVKGSAFKDGRRVGMRLDRDIEWVPVDMSRFTSRNRLILQTLNFIEELPVALVVSLSSFPEQKHAADQFTDPVLKKWLRNRVTHFTNRQKSFRGEVNTAVKRYGNSFLASPAYAALERQHFDSAISESKNYWNRLQQSINSKERSIATATPYPDTIYMRQRIKQSLETLDIARGTVDLIKETHEQFIE